MGNNKTTRLIEPDSFRWLSYPLRRHLYPISLKNIKADLEEKSTETLPFIRDRIFSSELRDVSNDVISHKPGIPGAENKALKLKKTTGIVRRRSKKLISGGKNLSIDSILNSDYFFNPVEPAFPPNVARWFASVGKSDIESEIDYDPLLTHMLSVSKAQSICCLIFDSHEFIYTLSFQKGLDEFTIKNICFSPNDSFLNENKRIQFIPFRRYQNDYFFKKRFSTNFFLDFHGALFLNLKYYNMQGYMIFFYKNLETESIRSFLSEISLLIRDMIPIIRRKDFNIKIENIDKNVSELIFRELNRVSRNGRDKMKVIQFHFHDIAEKIDLERILQEGADLVTEQISSAERVIIFPPNKILLLLIDRDHLAIVDQMVSFSKISGCNISEKIKIYPDHGNNLYNYI